MFKIGFTLAALQAVCHAEESDTTMTYGVNQYQLDNDNMVLMSLDAEAYNKFSVDLASNFISAAASTCPSNVCTDPYLPFTIGTSTSTQITQNFETYTASEVQAKACIESSSSSTPACVDSQTIYAVIGSNMYYYEDVGILGLGPTKDDEEEFSFVQGLA